VAKKCIHTKHVLSIYRCTKTFVYLFAARYVAYMYCPASVRVSGSLYACLRIVYSQRRCSTNKATKFGGITNQRKFFNGSWPPSPRGWGGLSRVSHGHRCCLRGLFASKIISPPKSSVAGRYTSSEIFHQNLSTTYPVILLCIKGENVTSLAGVKLYVFYTDDCDGCAALCVGQTMETLFRPVLPSVTYASLRSFDGTQCSRCRRKMRRRRRQRYDVDYSDDSEWVNFFKWQRTAAQKLGWQKSIPPFLLFPSSSLFHSPFYHFSS